VQGFKLSLHTEYGPQEAQSLKEWFGSAEAAQPFIDSGLLHISMSVFDTVQPCTKVCFLIASAMIYTTTLDASEAPLLLLDFEKKNNDTTQQLLDSVLDDLKQSVKIPATAPLVGTSGTTGVGKFAQSTFSFYAPVSNAVLVLQGGGRPDAVKAEDVIQYWAAMYDKAVALP
jgi:hypothetical protein